MCNVQCVLICSIIGKDFLLLGVLQGLIKAFWLFKQICNSSQLNLPFFIQHLKQVSQRGSVSSSVNSSSKMISLVSTGVEVRTAVN